KGVAWIAFSHDRDAASAKAIINALAVRKFMPEAHLLLAEIADYEGDQTEKLRHLKKFKSLVSTPRYRSMYHKYLAMLEAEEFNNAAGALKIAGEEIVNRPTPQSYDLLAWGYYHQKEFAKALAIASQKVEHQNYEPDALYHLGMIYHANGDNAKALQYLTTALESEFELGPALSRKIRTAIQNI
ncbi:MAG TPA: tetratricopeptide repeat protein, partial [Chryseolinea sp.]